MDGTGNRRDEKTCVVPATAGSKEPGTPPGSELHEDRSLPAKYPEPNTVPGTEQVFSGCLLGARMTQRSLEREKSWSARSLLPSRPWSVSVMGPQPLRR